MRRSSVPPTGPLRIDCRQMASGAAVRRVEDLLKRVRGGARLLRVVADAPSVVEAVVAWARVGGARAEVSAAHGRCEIRIYLLPSDFDGHPLVAWRPPPPSIDATPEGARLAL